MGKYEFIKILCDLSTLRLKEKQIENNNVISDIFFLDHERHETDGLRNQNSNISRQIPYMWYANAEH